MSPDFEPRCLREAREIVLRREEYWDGKAERRANWRYSWQFTLPVLSGTIMAVATFVLSEGPAYWFIYHSSAPSYMQVILPETLRFGATFLSSSITFAMTSIDMINRYFPRYNK